MSSISTEGLQSGGPLAHDEALTLQAQEASYYRYVQQICEKLRATGSDIASVLRTIPQDLRCTIMEQSARTDPLFRVQTPEGNSFLLETVTIFAHSIAMPEGVTQFDGEQYTPASGWITTWDNCPAKTLMPALSNIPEATNIMKLGEKLLFSVTLILNPGADSELPPFARTIFITACEQAVSPYILPQFEHPPIDPDLTSTQLIHIPTCTTYGVIVVDTSMDRTPDRHPVIPASPEYTQIFPPEGSYSLPQTTTLTHAATAAVGNDLKMALAFLTQMPESILTVHGGISGHTLFLLRCIQSCVSKEQNIRLNIPPGERNAVRITEIPLAQKIPKVLHTIIKNSFNAIFPYLNRERKNIALSDLNRDEQYSIYAVKGVRSYGYDLYITPDRNFQLTLSKILDNTILHLQIELKQHANGHHYFAIHLNTGGKMHPIENILSEEQAVLLIKTLQHAFLPDPTKLDGLALARPLQN